MEPAPAAGMDAFITALTTAISLDKLWEVFTSAVPFIVIAVLFTFGFTLVRKAIKGVSKGKTRM